MFCGLQTWPSPVGTTEVFELVREILVDARDRGQLETERANEASAELDRLGVREAVALMIEQERAACDALSAAADEIASAVELAAERLAAGGRLFYFGAGTSGRLGVLDAVECPPTFHTDPELVQGVLAGGRAALTRSVEGVEDSAEVGRLDLVARGVRAGDVVVGISAGGTTPYVHAALEAARARGAATVFLACVPRAQVPDDADVSIRVVTGPEVLAGSTRLKAGTATKLVLNTLSTLTMVRLGKVHGNLMVDVDTRASRKLADRGERLVMRIAGVDRATAAQLLARADGRVKVAVLVGRLRLDPDAARARLERAGGHLRSALE